MREGRQFTSVRYGGSSESSPPASDVPAFPGGAQARASAGPQAPAIAHLVDGHDDEVSDRLAVLLSTTSPSAWSTVRQIGSEAERGRNSDLPRPVCGLAPPTGNRKTPSALRFRRSEGASSAVAPTGFEPALLPSEGDQTVARNAWKRANRWADTRPVRSSWCVGPRPLAVAWWWGTYLVVVFSDTTVAVSPQRPNRKRRGPLLPKLACLWLAHHRQRPRNRRRLPCLHAGNTPAGASLQIERRDALGTPHSSHQISCLSPTSSIPWALGDFAVTIAPSQDEYPMYLTP